MRISNSEMSFESQCNLARKMTEGQTVVELETDKAVVEVPSALSGTVSEVKVQVGQKLKVGDLILTIAATAGSGRARC